MKRLIWIIPSLLIIILITFSLYIKLALPKVGKAPSINVELTPKRIERGKYLANSVMSCVDCHSLRDFTKYPAPLTGTPFGGGGEEFTEEKGAPGNFYAPNLTPFHLASWTDGEIYRAITEGVSKDGRALFPSMPYLLYGKASTEDIYSVIAYLRTLSSFDNSVPAPQPKFPFNIIMKFIPQKAAPNKIPDKKNQVEYGKYMITIAGCIDCHTPMKKGQFVMEKAYAGNGEFIVPTGIVRSANITPDKNTGIGNWSEAQFVHRFKNYADSSFVPEKVAPGAFNTVMPWMIYSKMKTEDIKSIFAYLQTLDPIESKIVRFTPKQ